MRGIKNKEQTKIKRIVIFIILFIALILLLSSVYRVYNKKRNAEEALLKMQKELQTLEERENFLKISLERLETEEGMKFELRKRLDVALEGEKVAIIVNEEEEQEMVAPQKTLWEKIKNFFLNL